MSATMNEQYRPIVNLIVRKCPQVAAEAMGIMRSSSPELRLRALAPRVLGMGEWTPEELDLLIEIMGEDDEPEERTRSKMVALRVTPEEHAALMRVAEERNMSLSEYVRTTLGL